MSIANFDNFEIQTLSKLYIYLLAILCYGIISPYIKERGVPEAATVDMTLGKRLRDARKACGMTQRQLAACINAKHNSISNWETDQNMPDPNTIEKLCSALSISPNYLLLGQSDTKPAILLPADGLSVRERELIRAYRILDETAKGAIDALVLHYSGQKSAGRAFSPALPLESSHAPLSLLQGRISTQGVAAGTGTWLDPEDFDSITILNNDLTRRAAFFVPVEGDSMEPRYRDGDVLIVEDSAVRQGQIGIFTVDGHGYVKELGDGMLLSLNPQYDPILLQSDTVCNGRVIGVLEPEWIVD